MDAKALKDLARKYFDNRQFITNEEMTKQSLIIPFIAALGYDPSNPREVRLEFAAEFTENDGKRFRDRMDFAIFDQAGQKPLLVIEAKPLGSDVRAKSQQLARYVNQLLDLRFGIITDGCEYLLYSDLTRANVMDNSPFFSFSLADNKLDFDSVARFLSKFSRDEFNAEQLVAEAEDSTYRLQIIDRLASVLRLPQSDEAFLKWLVGEIYPRKLTSSVLERMGRLASEAIQPAMLRVIGDDFLANLRTRIQDATGDKAADLGPSGTSNQIAPAAPLVPTTGAGQPTPQKLQVPPSEEGPANRIVTTEEELAFYRKVRDVCLKMGESPDQILYKDTVNYFNVSFKTATRWFVRLFGDAKRKALTTLVPIEEAKILAVGFEVDNPPQNFGASRVYVDSADQVWALSKLIARSLEICKPRVAQEDQSSEKARVEVD